MTHKSAIPDWITCVSGTEARKKEKENEGGHSMGTKFGS